VQTRLLRHAKALGQDPNFLLARYAAERFLYRLSVSPHAERFVLKGALLMLAWLGETVRATRDVDFLGYGDLDTDALRAAIVQICQCPVAADGLTFEPDTIRIEPIRENATYGGRRVTLRAKLGNARIPLQLDIGVGDATIPEPEWLDFPSLLDFPPPRLRAYRPETSIAEKLHAMVVLGEANSRLRDYFDIYALATQRRFQSTPLIAAVRATFARRDTPLPSFPPAGLTRDFALQAGKQAQWRAFIERTGASAPPELTAVIEMIGLFLDPIVSAAHSGEVPDLTWPPGGPWA
jgi:predicted nucleotidyltransferase component of viral defense system